MTTHCCIREVRLDRQAISQGTHNGSLSFELVETENGSGSVVENVQEC